LQQLATVAERIKDEHAPVVLKFVVVAAFVARSPQTLRERI
jgi:hypothetical protein